MSMSCPIPWLKLLRNIHLKKWFSSNTSIEIPRIEHFYKKNLDIKITHNSFASNFRKGNGIETSDWKMSRYCELNSENGQSHSEIGLDCDNGYKIDWWKKWQRSKSYRFIIYSRFLPASTLTIFFLLHQILNWIFGYDSFNIYQQFSSFSEAVSNKEIR